MTEDKPDRLESIVEARATRPPPPAVRAIADALRDAHGQCVKAVLAYGSCLRGVGLSEGIVDLYVLVDSERAFHRSMLAAWANRAVPPNVYFFAHDFAGRKIRAKYAVISLRQFCNKMSARTANPYFWARFAQPALLLHAGDDAVREKIITALATAVRTMLGHGRALAGDDADAKTLWTAVMGQTYRTELRSEPPERAAMIHGHDRAYYAAVTGAVPPPDNGGAVSASWGMRRATGKALSLARLVKAAFTFSGGADYIAWKIERHSGVKVALKPWQRRHPLVAGLILLPKVYFKGGFR